ncbi:MAG: DNA polymerase-3 subunit epsilon [Alphaproteobacteria bacterium]|jgi:DNA polymerase-3 subunit epsilon
MTRQGFMAFRDLPTFYYHTHFSEFLDFVKGPSAHLLSPDDKVFLEKYEQASHLQQCLVVRLINRKYSLVKRSSLRFAEIPLAAEIMNDLDNLGFIRKVQIEDVPALLTLFTKPELAALYEEVANIDSPRLVKSANKAAFTEQCQTLCQYKVVDSTVAEDYCVRTTDSFINYFLFLYFGHTNGRLNQFSMRDLGLMRTRDEQAQMQSRFIDYENAYSCFVLTRAYHQAKNHAFESESSIHSFMADLPIAYGAQAAVIAGKLGHAMAKHMTTFNPNQGLKIAEPLQDPLAQEFWCRQAYKLGLKEAVKAKLNAIIDDPSTDKLLQFAEDFLARKYHQKRTSILTDMLRENNRHLLLDETYKGTVEYGVIAYYQARDIQAWRTENNLWKNLFGLCFWHELFELDGLGLATPFDYLPACIKHHDFIEVAGSQITARLDALASSKDLLLLVTKHAATHFGKSQGIVHWHANMLDRLKVLIENAPLAGLKGQLLAICSDWQLYNDGYPDIMVLENQELRFEEIKAQGDSLRRNQLMQLQSLRSFGIDVGITTVGWTLDPMQAYSVIDIETTGGRAGTHKITEIGMVKMINGEVVDQWQSLINPERRIPSMITSLTGITNDMVADAPLFADIADEFETFTENCIFVAHNVNFDYGFIREEFARLNRTYRRPKLCTVQQMRTHFKGLASYSLANLTKHFDIGMQRHHRALSDAVAASELLKLVNEARQVQ